MVVADGDMEKRMVLDELNIKGRPKTRRIVDIKLYVSNDNVNV